jgi:hypothetical protein
VKKSIRVHSYLRKGHVVSHHSKVVNIKRRGVIGPGYKKVFTYLSWQPDEYGGQIDFEKNGIERITVNKGGPTGVDKVLDEDYESTFHTHPEMDDPLLGLSPTDLAESIKQKTEQAQMIISRGNAVIITKTPKMKLLEKQSIPSLEKHFLKEFNNLSKQSKSDKEYLDKLKTGLRSEGFHITEVAANKENIEIPIEVK